MRCFYCEGDVTEATRVLSAGRVFHSGCYVAYIHDLMQVIRQHADSIVSYTQGTNAAANSKARRIIEVAERF